MVVCRRKIDGVIKVLPHRSPVKCGSGSFWGTKPTLTQNVCPNIVNICSVEFSVGIANVNRDNLCNYFYKKSKSKSSDYSTYLLGNWILGNSREKLEKPS